MQSRKRAWMGMRVANDCPRYGRDFERYALESEKNQTTL